MPNPFDQFDPTGGTGPLVGPAPKPAAAPAPPSAIAIAREERDRLDWEATHNPDGSLKPKPATASEKPADRAKVATLESLVGQINQVEQLYNSGIRDETLWNAFGALDGIGPTAGEFDSAGQGVADQALAAFRVPGMGAQSDLEARQFANANTPQAGDWDAAIEQKLRNLRGRVDQARKAYGLPPAQWGVASAFPAAPQDDQRDPLAAGIMGGDLGNGPAPGLPTGGDAGPVSPAMGGTRTVEDNPALAAEYRQRLAAGQKASEIIPWLRSQGMPPQVLMQAVEQLRYRQQNPDVPIDRYRITSTREEPISGFEQAATDLGSGAAGAYALGAGQFLSGNTLDNMAADPERARLALAVSEAQNPGATLAGQISGGVLASLTGEAGLARLGMASGLGRGVLADAAMGAANGAGAADGGDRMAGFMQGGLAATAGSLAGNAAMAGAGRVLSPSGGSLADLYAAGVRPTPGQRFADGGMLGRAVNATEEALQSVPIVGTAISGARQGARDQFQIGAFNQALAEVGETLPKGMKPGTDPHKYAQGVFNRVYDEARSGMRMVVDEELSNDLSALAPDISTLGPQATNKLRAIMSNSVNSKLVQGELSGAAYKTAVADLARHTARLRKSAMGEDQALADILDGAAGAIDSAARRHSDPAAVELLDAADAGYARLVRIEDAAARRGGDDGTFSPTRFDSAVQRASGGVRSKAYLRGDAMMQDYANQGKALVDRMPNSGTSDRAMVAGGLGAAGAAYLEPTTLGVLGAIGAAYAPGVRKALTGALAPAGPTRKALAQRLKNRARLIGKVGAAGAAASLPGTTPGQ